MKRLAGRMDFERWVAQTEPVVPAALLLGVLVQQQFQPIPPHNPNEGWSRWIWETHGRAIVNCAVEAMPTDAEVDCVRVVGRSQP